MPELFLLPEFFLGHKKHGFLLRDFFGFVKNVGLFRVDKF